MPSAEPPRRVLVTGCYRSGTTLAEKLLHSHPGAVVASQPAPNLWAVVKQGFLDDRGLVRRYPLGHLFRELSYTSEEWTAYLDDLELDETRLFEIGDQLLANPDGTWTPEIPRRWREVVPAGFWGVVDQLLSLVIDELGEADVVGFKEILVEEYLPALLAHGWAGVVVVRDPRDMVASLDHADRENLTGAHRPLLYSLRLWRKSVAFAAAASLRGDPVELVRYEDLVADPAGALGPALLRLGLDPSTLDPTRPLRDQRGRVWSGNSSFSDHHGVSSDNVATRRDRLPPATIGYIETVCRPEMRRLGYDVAGRPLDRSELLGYREAVTPVHARFGEDYSRVAASIDDELRRLDLVAETLEPAAAAGWFIDPAAHEWLRQAL